MWAARSASLMLMLKTAQGVQVSKWHDRCCEAMNAVHMYSSESLQLQQSSSSGSYVTAFHDIRHTFCSHLACRLEEKPIDAAVAEVNMCAAPAPEGYQQTQGVQGPLYAAFTKKVSLTAQAHTLTPIARTFF